MSISEGIPYVAGLVALWAFLQKTHNLEKDKQALLAKVAELEEKLRAIDQERIHTLNQVRCYYEQSVEGHEKILEGSKAFGEALRTLAIFFARELERLEPGWFERRLKHGRDAGDGAIDA
jgi:hypothetical protein